MASTDELDIQINENEKLILIILFILLFALPLQMTIGIILGTCLGIGIGAELQYRHLKKSLKGTVPGFFIKFKN